MLTVRILGTSINNSCKMFSPVYNGIQCFVQYTTAIFFFFFLIRNIYLAPAGKSFSDINCAEFGLSFCWRCLFGLIFQEIYFISQYNLANGTLLTFSTCTSLKSNVKRYQRSTLCSFQYMVHGIHFFGMKKRTWFNYITQYFFTKTTLTVFVTPGLFTTTQ